MKLRFCLLLLAVLSLAGCTKRSILRFEDHPTQQKTYVETLRVDNYFVSSSRTHEFWLCDDNENELVCARTCDGSTDLKCPASGTSISISGSGTNVR